ncbi:glycosyltransferase domain-containing protein [Xenorhabdus bovienii]
MHSDKILIYTALFGNYDILHEPVIDDDLYCDYICITDRKDINSKKWKIINVNNENRNNIEENRRYKMMPHLFFRDYRYVIYVDANIIIKNSPKELINKYLKKNPIAFPKHFLRNCIYEEAKFCLGINKITENEYNNIIN